MRAFRSILLAVTLVLAPPGFWPPTTGTPAPMAQDQVPSLAPMLERVLPAVVSIAVRGREQEPQEREFQAVGSGVIVDPERGHVITNHHVVEEADEITVALSDGRRFQGKKIGADPGTDIAIIQVPTEHLVGLPLGDSDLLKVGDYVVAVGNSFGLGQTVTSGIVSALGRTGLGIEGYGSFIQTDASINPGNSGGALVNLRGELIGINSVIVVPSGGSDGVGFAIPINMARQVMAQLIAHGKVSRGQLGIRIQDLTPELIAALKIDVHEGSLIADVTPESPADRAGLEIADVITRVNGEKVRNSAELRNMIALLSLGSKVVIDVLRKGRAMQVIAGLTEAMPKELEVPGSIPALSGVTLGTIEPGSRLYGHAEGAVVLAVKGDSRAAGAGLRPGDVIVSVNQKPVMSPREVVDAAGEVKGTLLLQVIRDGTGLFIAVG